MEYEIISSEGLADEASSVYESGKEFVYDHVLLTDVVRVETSTKQMTINVNAQRRSMKGILLLFVKHCGDERFRRIRLSGPQKSLGDKKRLTKYCCTSTASKAMTAWSQVSRFFMQEKAQTTAYDSAEVLRRRQVWTSDRSAFYGQSRNARQRHPPHQHNRRSSAANRERHRKRTF